MEKAELPPEIYRPRRHCLHPLPYLSRLELSDTFKTDIGLITPELFHKVFRISIKGTARQDDLFYISIAPGCPPQPEPEASLPWTIAAVKLDQIAATGLAVTLPSASPTLQSVARSFAQERPDLKSLRHVEVLVAEVQPLTLQRVFVRLDGDALARHVEVQKKFRGGFSPQRGKIALRNAQSRKQLAASVEEQASSDGELADQVKDQIKDAVRESLGKPAIVHRGDIVPLPLPTHPITHEAFPRIEIIYCEPVDQGIISGETDIVVDMRRRRRKSATEAPKLAGDGVRTASRQNGESDQESTAESSTSTEESTSSDDSADNLISLSTAILSERPSGLASPKSTSTLPTRPQRSGATSPGSVFSTFTTATGHQRSRLGRLVQLKPLTCRVPGHLLHPVPSPGEDDEARLFVDVKTLARLGCFSGDWVRITAIGQVSKGQDHPWSAEAFGGDETSEVFRVLKVYGLTETGYGQNDDRLAKASSRNCGNPRLRPSSVAFVSPILYANLDHPSEVYIAPITTLQQREARTSRRRIASSELPPVAKEVTLTRLPNPLSTEKAMQHGIFEGLKRYFERRRRIIRAGDRIAIIFDINASRLVASIAPSGELDSRLSTLLEGSPLTKWRQQGPVGVAWFQIDKTSDAETPKNLSSLDPAIWGGAVCIEPTHTKMTQKGSRQSEEPPALENPWRYYVSMHKLQVADTELSIVKRATMTVEQRFASPLRRRLRELFTAATSPQALAIGIRPLVVLLHSSQAGAGKIYSTIAACADLGLHFFRIDGWDVLTEGGDGNDAKTEGSLRAKLERAATCGGKYTVPLIRHIEALSADRIASTLKETLAYFRVLVLTTREIGNVSDSLRGLVTHELEITAPDERERKAILWSALIEKGIRLAPNVELDATARKTAAMSAGDLSNVVDRSIIARRTRLGDVAASLPRTLVRDILVAGGWSARCITAGDLDKAVEGARKGFADSIGAPKIPDVPWEDVGGLSVVKDTILETIQLPLEHPELFAKGLKKRSGILLYGPPGTGKTLLAKAIATSFTLNFFSVKGPELLNMYIGESEANVRRVFARARDARPCVVFFDELDAVAPKRGNQGDSGGVMDRIVSQLLAELDGMSSDESGAGGVFVVGATNRPDLLDPALLRPGRFDKMLYLGVADTHEQQLHILEALTRRFSLAEDLSLARVAQRLPFTYTGADLYALCADAMLKAMMRKVHAVDAKILAMPGEKITPAQFFDRHATEEDIKVQVTEDDFRAAQSQLVTSVSAKELEHYQRVRKSFENPPTNTNGDAALGPRVSSPIASRSDANASHLPQLKPALPMPVRRKSSSAQSNHTARPTSSRPTRGPTWSYNRQSGNAVKDGTDESDEDQDESDDGDEDDEGFVTSNDYATTPERRGVRGDSVRTADWKGKGKARASLGGSGTENRERGPTGFGYAADGEDLYDDD